MTKVAKNRAITEEKKSANAKRNSLTTFINPGHRQGKKERSHTFPILWKKLPGLPQIPQTL